MNYGDLLSLLLDWSCEFTGNLYGHLYGHLYRHRKGKKGESGVNWVIVVDRGVKAG